MNSAVSEASAWRRNVPGFLAATLLVVVCPEMRTISAAECDPHCDRSVHPSQYGDPRCESRRIGPHPERDELRCGPREPRRKVVHPAPSAKPPPPSLPVPSVGQASGSGASDPGQQQSRGVDRDVGFDDAFTTQANPGAGGGVRGANANANANADPVRRTPPGRSR